MEVLKHRPDIKKLGGAIRKSIYPTAALSIATVAAGVYIGDHLVQMTIAAVSENNLPQYANPDFQDDYRSALKQAYTDLTASPSRVLQDGTYIQGIYPNTQDAEAKLLKVESNLPLEEQSVNKNLTYPLLRVSSSFSGGLTTSLARFNGKDVTNATFSSQRVLIMEAKNHIADLAKTPAGHAYQQANTLGLEHVVKAGIGAVSAILLSIGVSIANTKRKS